MRWQRVSPTERRGRVHTSTVTVVVLPEFSDKEVFIEPKDLEWKYTKGSGPGGQHRNKTSSAVQLYHKPSGVRIRSETEKSQKQNKEIALSVLKAKLLNVEKEKEQLKRSSIRKKQKGSGQRGDKIRTVRLQDGVVTDHRTNKKMRAKKYLRGFIEDLY